MIPLTRIPELCDGVTCRSAKRFAVRAGLAFNAAKMFETIFRSLGAARILFVTAREVAVVFRFYIAAFVFARIAALPNPFRAQRGNADA